MCFMCTSPLASLVQLVLAIDVIVKIKICLQLSPQIVYNCSPDCIFILVCKLPLGNVCKESLGIVSKLSPGVVYKAKNHQDLFPNCHDHQELFTNYRSEMFAKNHRELFPDCQQLLTKLFLQAVPGKVSASVAVAA